MKKEVKKRRKDYSDGQGGGDYGKSGESRGIANILSKSSQTVTVTNPVIQVANKGWKKAPVKGGGKTPVNPSKPSSKTPVKGKK